jgi:hypothetical protein
MKKWMTETGRTDYTTLISGPVEAIDFVENAVRKMKVWKRSTRSHTSLPNCNNSSDEANL